MNLESDKRLNIQLRLDFPSAPSGEARQAGREDIESLSAVNDPERPANTSSIVLAQLLEPPCTDPYARWCGRGGAARLPPIPIAATLCSGPTEKSSRLELTSAIWGSADQICSG